jgi:hypothetical protein
MKLRSFMVALLFAALPLFAQTPTPREFLGYELGARFTPHHRILDYFEELTRRSNLITVQEFGSTYEGRPLVLAVLTSPKNRAALDTIRRNLASLGSGESADLAKTTPAAVWLAFGVHGAESSSAEAAMLVASTLVREAEWAPVLENLVVVIDPLQNPDGRQRYIEWFHRTKGVEADPNPQAFEHIEPWPGGRYNHYLLDMNRDWAWLSQKETQARAAEYRKWNPQVFVDFHEMGYDSNYFFPPTAKPINANLPKDIERWLDVFGRANAEVFSARGWPFFVAEYFDLFYPGYGDSWPSLHGAIGMTYEVAGGPRGGLSVRRDDQSVLTLADRIERHFTTAVTTLRTAAQNREQLLRYTYAAARAPRGTAGSTFLIVPGSPNFDALVDLLRKHGIELRTLAVPATLRATRLDADGPESRSFPAGTVLASTQQPLGAFLQTLMERAPALSKGFVDEQRLKAEADEPDDFYDLTTWSLPLAMNVEGYVVAGNVIAETRAFDRPGARPFQPAAYGYLVDGLDPNVYRFAGRLLAGGVKFSVADAEINVNNSGYARGTLVILKGNNTADLDRRLQDAVAATGARVVSLQSGWTGGTALGSDRINFVREPRIALVGGAGTSPTSYGMLWHTLDIDTPIPHTRLSLDSLRNVDLEKYEVIVLPDGDYADRLGKRGTERLQAWIRDGGTIVAIRGASAFLRMKDVEISKIKPWEPPKKKDDKEEEAPQEGRYNEFRVPGSAFRTTMNPRSYLTFGVPRSPAVLIEGTTALLPVSHKVDNIVTIDARNPLISGVAWPESIERLKGSVYLVSEPYGKGNVITFADDPHFRLFWRGTLPLFLNAVLYSPSFPR